MLYISIMLITLGALIFVYSMFLDIRTRAQANSTPGLKGNESSPVTRHPSSAESRRQTWEKSEDFPHLHEDMHLRKSDSESGDAVKADTGERSAILYEDKSGVIDFNHGSGDGIPEIEEYKNIQRIGRGALIVEKGGISFTVGRKLYRYDFHRVRDVKAGDKYLALFLQGSEAVKLFIFEGGSDRSGEIDSIYREYMRGATQNVR